MKFPLNTLKFILLSQFHTNYYVFFVIHLSFICYSSTAICFHLLLIIYFNNRRNVVLQIGPTEQLVRDCTNNDPWAAKMSDKQEVARKTFNLYVFHNYAIILSLRISFKFFRNIF